MEREKKTSKSGPWKLSIEKSGIKTEVQQEL